MSEWISVKDRLPDCNGEYLILKTFYGHTFCKVARYTNNYVGFDTDMIPTGTRCFYGYDSEVGDVEIGGVTHWMPIPEFPKEEQK